MALKYRYGSEEKRIALGIFSEISLRKLASFVTKHARSPQIRDCRLRAHTKYGSNDFADTSGNRHC